LTRAWRRISTLATIWANDRSRSAKAPLGFCQATFGFPFGEGSIDHLLQLFHGTHFLFGEPAAAKSS
jgi:hypothetical protein